MVQKIKYHFANLDKPYEAVSDSIPDLPGIPTIGLRDQLASIELDLLIETKKDVDDLHNRLVKMRNLLPNA